jgi:hypothetical protein
MGLQQCSAPATFERAMQLVLRGLTWTQVLVYLDDIIVLGMGHFLTASTFDGETDTLFALTNFPRNSTSSLKSSHFLGFNRCQEMAHAKYKERTLQPMIDWLELSRLQLILF